MSGAMLLMSTHLAVFTRCSDVGGYDLRIDYRQMLPVTLSKAEEAWLTGLLTERGLQQSSYSVVRAANGKRGTTVGLTIFSAKGQRPLKISTTFWMPVA